ncbi:MAG: hypothetical protein H8K10_09995 [Nitrospira sp.]|jgi:hypothetical protein|nr:hypothetical protein [Nitrospira sp.]MCS6289295.1 hypothetical protein [Nitrospira sp.]
MAKRKQTSNALLKEIDKLASLPIDKFTDDYIGGLIRQVATRLRSTDPRDKKPSTGSGYRDWDYALVQIRRLELDAIRKHLWKVTKK